MNDPDSPGVPVGREMGLRHILPRKQDFGWLISVALFTAHNIASGFWNKGVMEAHL